MNRPSLVLQRHYPILRVPDHEARLEHRKVRTRGYAYPSRPTGQSRGSSRVQARTLGSLRPHRLHPRRLGRL